MHECPKCKSPDIHRSRSRSRWERWRKEITGKRTYRCHACGWRGWGWDLGPSAEEVEREAAARALAPDPPNLKKTAFARDGRQHPGIDLEKLDALEAANDERSPKPPRRD